MRSLGPDALQLPGPVSICLRNASLAFVGTGIAPAIANLSRQALGMMNLVSFINLSSHRVLNNTLVLAQ